MQERLPTEQPSKSQIEKIAHIFVREQYGTIPSIGVPELKDEKWFIPINANYPRLLFSEAKQSPERVRFMKFNNLGELEISENGKILSKPRYFEIASGIQRKLEEVRRSVEKALIKVAAGKFSLLTFPDHMFTPIQDILSWLLINDSIQLNEFLENVLPDKKEKYLQNFKILEDVKLIKSENGVILPANSLVEIEMKKELSKSQKLAAALTLFYERGYEHIDTITSFLGPHLIISGYVYEESLECNQILAIKEKEFQGLIAEYYTDKSKFTKVPRYLLQLEAINLLIPSRKSTDAWEPNPEIFQKLKGEEELIAPIREMIITN